jgi:hypothetical protein
MSASHQVHVIQVWHPGPMLNEKMILAFERPIMVRRSVWKVLFNRF